MLQSRTSFRALGPIVCLAFLASAPRASAQIDWVTVHEDNSHLVAAGSLGLNDTEERDYAWGDLDKDGWIDLVVVRKQPFTTTGRRVNVLFMNEGGVLVDRSDPLAKDSDVGGDNGFLTATNDRDVVIVDVDLDGWLDVVTSSTLSPGQPKHISHPRVYMNKGEDAGGNWLGLRFENARIPNFGTFPNFCAVAAGDVTGDGFPDLYFAHYEQSANVDLNDRLLVNDGTGHFVDESAARMSAGMLISSFGVAAAIEDMNGDGVNDVVKDTALGQTGGNGPRVTISYNDPNNEGFFNILDQAYAGAPYHVTVGDLNQDGKLDLVIADDSSDRFLLNQGNDVLGRVIWSAAKIFVVNDDGFASNVLIRDLDQDGWNDVLIADVDVDISGCDRRMHIYHNQGGAVGGNVTLSEESGGGSRGVQGMTSSDLRGTHDVAVFDLDNDGDMDMVVGRCSGTSVWINDEFTPGIGDNYCGPAVNNSSGQPGVMRGEGSTVVTNNDVELFAEQLPFNRLGYFLTSTTQGTIVTPPGSQGTLCLAGQIGRYAKQVQNSGGAGAFSMVVDLTSMPPLQSAVIAGETWNFTAWFRDVNPNQTSNFTDGLSILFQ